MRLIGIDFGIKNIGVAISNEEANLAFPLTVLDNNKDFFQKISDICEKEGIEAVILGESKDFLGKENPIMKKIHFLKEKLEKDLNKKVFFEPEFLTTKEATHIQGDIEKIDASAAAIILQSFLDKNKDKLN